MEQGSAQQHLTRLESLKGARSNFDILWDLVQRIVWPDGGEFNRTTANGEKRTRDIYEMTAALALEDFAAVMEFSLTPRSTIWSRPIASDPNLNKDPEVKAWFEQLNEVLFSYRNSPQARFYGQMHEGWKALGSTGNMNIYVDELAGGGIRYKYTHVGKSWIETNFQGVVDTVYHEYPLSARAAIQRWGDDAPDRAKTMVEQTPDQEMTYVHCVQPNEEYDPDRADALGMPFESFDISVEDSAIIDQGGVHEMPYIWSRYTVNPNEKYGRGPAMLVLPDIQTLQEMNKVFMRSGHKVADPPLLVANDGVIGRGSKRIRINPGGINIGGVDQQGRQMIQPLQTGARLDMTKEMMDIIRDTIKKAFLNHHLERFADRPGVRTATEVMEEAKRDSQALTPVVGRQQSEALGPMHAREIGIAMRQGRLGELPEALIEAEGEYEIEYESEATRMQKSGEAAGFSRMIEVLAPLIENDPSLLDKFKGEDAIDHFSEVYAVPSKLLNTEAEMKPIRKAQAEAAQQQTQLDQIEQGSNAARNIAPLAVA